eukprot:CAMPEP_0204368106 /NCGR_PEP_ID=MMETSP0469-20131031/43946_1 /ASSEMBLY_ACC=CAM_ASM_000384 /TAXON_ID=2969 /ORGANISM="Oxyrrhis marina" /LENGTH=69 /DNA_ID=CAMNT_0051357619 /DNA_START=29 /DNA_END=235 /DNA_ORIENTATION=+
MPACQHASVPAWAGLVPCKAAGQGRRPRAAAAVVGCDGASGGWDGTELPSWEELAAAKSFVDFTGLAAS